MRVQNSQAECLNGDKMNLPGISPGISLILAKSTTFALWSWSWPTIASSSILGKRDILNRPESQHWSQRWGVVEYVEMRGKGAAFGMKDLSRCHSRSDGKRGVDNFTMKKGASKTVPVG